MTIKVIIAAHRPYAVPDDDLYLPLQVGAQRGQPIGFAGDNTGDNISEKNPSFCELTGLYWAWKNLSDDYIGLVHYRRYFGHHRPARRFFDRILTGEQAQALLAGRDGLLPAPRHYIIESLYSHYQNTCHIEPLDAAGDIIRERCPAYLPAFERLHHRRSAHMFNMFILRRDHLDAYCRWLFDILFELEHRVDASAYSAFQARFFGRVSELLLDVWLDQNPLDCAVLPVISPEHTPWLKKGAAFLSAKFTHKKYEQSF